MTITVGPKALVAPIVTGIDLESQQLCALTGTTALATWADFTGVSGNNSKAAIVTRAGASVTVGPVLDWTDTKGGMLVPNAQVALTSTLALLVYSNNDDSDFWAYAFDCSGATPVLGPGPFTIEANPWTQDNFVSMVPLDATHALVSWLSIAATSDLWAAVLTVDPATFAITMGTSVSYGTLNEQAGVALSVLSSDKVLACWGQSDIHGVESIHGVVLNVSGTTVSPAAPSTSPAAGSMWDCVAFDATHALVTWSAPGSNSYPGVLDITIDAFDNLTWGSTIGAGAGYQLPLNAVGSEAQFIFTNEMLVGVDATTAWAFLQETDPATGTTDRFVVIQIDRSGGTYTLQPPVVIDNTENTSSGGYYRAVVLAGQVGLVHWQSKSSVHPGYLAVLNVPSASGNWTVGSLAENAAAGWSAGLI